MQQRPGRNKPLPLLELIPPAKRLDFHRPPEIRRDELETLERFDFYGSTHDKTNNSPTVNKKLMHQLQDMAYIQPEKGVR